MIRKVGKRRIYYKQDVPHQVQFHNSTKPKVYLSTGYGGGKTYSLIMKQIKLSQLNPGLPGGLVVPSMRMFKRDVKPTIEEICQDNHIPFIPRMGDGYYYFPDTGSRWYIFHAQDEGRSMRGPNLAYMGFNEITLIDEASFKAAIARVRLKKAPFKQVIASGTPEGFNWTYEYFVEDPREDTELIIGDARANSHVAAEYFKMLEESYDELMAQQYIGGEWIDIRGGRACWSFNRRVHADETVHKVDSGEVWVSIDFNVDPMACTLWSKLSPNHRIDQRLLGTELVGFKSLKIPNSNTWELAKEINKLVNTERERVVLFPDPAGDSRSTQSKNLTDIDILEQEIPGAEIRYRSKTKSVKDCLNSLNSLLHQKKMVLNTKEARDAVADFEQCIIKPGTNFEIDKTNPKRTHWLDGAKCMAEYQYPIRIARQGRIHRRA